MEGGIQKDLLSSGNPVESLNDHIPPQDGHTDVLVCGQCPARRQE